MQLLEVVVMLLQAFVYMALHAPMAPGNAESETDRGCDQVRIDSAVGQSEVGGYDVHVRRTRVDFASSLPSIACHSEQAFGPKTHSPRCFQSLRPY